MALNVTTAVIGSGCNAATASPSLAQWDKGQILQISGVELPDTYKVEFSNADTLEAIPAIGTAEGVEIPDKLLYSSSPIRAYIVLSEAEGERNTEYWVTIYVKPREIPEDIEPTPAQQDVIDDLIAQMNTGVGKADAAADAAEASAGEAEAASQAVQDLGVRAETAASGAPAAVQKIVDAETGAVTLVFFLPQGEAGFSPVVTVTTITGGHRVTVTDADGAHSFDVMDGRSVTGVTMGADYKLTFTFSDGTTWTTPTSIRGETGATPRLTIGTVSTLDPGQGATAEITGTPEDPVLNLGIPKGQAGASDAGGVTYDPTESYQSGTAGAALNDLSRQLSDLEDTVSTTQIINTASGAIASFPDGADSMPIRKLVANIEPVQDLHGYDAPWPAGGGVNILPPLGSFTANGLTVTPNSNGSITVSGTATGSGGYLSEVVNLAKTIPANTSFAISTTNNVPSKFRIFPDSGTIDIGEGNNSVVISKDVDITKVRFYMFTTAGTTYNFVIFLMIEIGSTISQYQPYSNICPISGHTGAEIEQRGKNLLDFENQSLPHLPNVDYVLDFGEDRTFENLTLTFFMDGAQYSSSTAAICDYKKNDGTHQYRLSTAFGLSPANVNTGAFSKKETNITFRKLIFFLGTSYGAYSTGVCSAQLELGSTATAYAPYTGNQISVIFPETIYGGEDEVISGKLTDNMKSVKVSDLPVNAQFEVGSYACWKRFVLPATCKPVLYNQDHGSISSMGTEALAYYGTKHINEASAVDVDYAIPPDGLLLAVYDSDLTLTDETFMAKYGDMQVVYPLAETVEYTLTENEMDTLYGTNNFWSSTGDTEVTYPADTKLYIDAKIAEAVAALNS